MINELFARRLSDTDEKFSFHLFDSCFATVQPIDVLVHPTVVIKPLTHSTLHVSFIALRHEET